MQRRLRWIRLSSLLILPGMVFCLFRDPGVFASGEGTRDALPVLKSGGRGLFVTVIADPPVLSSREEIGKLIDFSLENGIQVLFVQIYRANRAWFPSKIADASPYENSLEHIGEDPFRLLIREAHEAGIDVHAWLNLLSLADNKNAPILEKYGPEILTRNTQEKKNLEDYKIDNQYFLEPGDPRVRSELSNVVTEILGAYPDLDGIQFDYIRYPDQHPAYGHTKINLERFKKANAAAVAEESSPVWKQWKRDQVTGLLDALVGKTRELRPDIRISTTGCTSYTRAYHEAFQDWPAWVNRGLVNFVTLMNYSPHFSEFAKDIAEARGKVGDFKKVKIGIGAYKLMKYPERFAKIFRLCEKAGGGGCVVFHYGSMTENPALVDALQDGKQ